MADTKLRQIFTDATKFDAEGQAWFDKDQAIAELSKLVEHVIGEDRHSDELFCKVKCRCYWQKVNDAKAEQRARAKELGFEVK